MSMGLANEGRAPAKSSELPSGLIEGASPLSRRETKPRSRCAEGLFREVSERLAQLELANRELEAFAFSVSHELRAPLRIVDGFARILEEEHSALLNEEGRRALAVVRGEASRMGRLIEDLLYFSRMERQDLRLSDIDMRALVRDVFEHLTVQAAHRDVDFRVEELPSARADPSLLWQVWYNLLDNALKYTRHRPSARIGISGRRQGAENLYTIQDNGAGFDMASAGKLFGVFQRLHRPEEFEGIGVGLALVRRVIRRHGGRVGAKAQLERGATFFFTLPSSEAAEAGLGDGAT